jgi:hypothetical protein
MAMVSITFDLDDRVIIDREEESFLFFGLNQEGARVPMTSWLFSPRRDLQN